MQGIMFIEELTVATAEGRKTRTRRVIDPQPAGDFAGYAGILNTKTGENRILSDFTCGKTYRAKYQLGEVLYIKEPWAPADGRIIYKYGTSDRPEVKWQNKQGMPAYIARTFIRITGIRVQRLQDITEEEAIREGICQYEWGTDRLRGVCYQGYYNLVGRNKGRSTETDPFPFHSTSAIDAFKILWDSLAKTGQKWEDNPWVWVYDYELTTKPEQS